MKEQGEGKGKPCDLPFILSSGNSSRGCWHLQHTRTKVVRKNVCAESMNAYVYALRGGSEIRHSNENKLTSILPVPSNSSFCPHPSSLPPLKLWYVQTSRRPHQTGVPTPSHRNHQRSRDGKILISAASQVGKGIAQSACLYQFQTGTLRAFPHRATIIKGNWVWRYD